MKYFKQLLVRGSFAKVSMCIRDLYSRKICARGNMKEKDCLWTDCSPIWA